MIISYDTAIADYHASDRVSVSKLKTLDEHGPVGYRARHLTAEVRQRPTPAMVFGNAFECAAQDPATFLAQYVEIDDVGDKDALLLECEELGLLTEDAKPYTKRHGVSTLKTALCVARGQSTLKRAEFVAIERMVANLEANEDVQRAIRGMRKQASLIADTPLDVLPGFQSRPDWYDPDTGGSVDLKCTAHFARFDSEIINRRMHAQASMIERIAGAPSTRHLVACENVWPYRVQLVTLSEPWIAVGHAWCEAQLNVLRECYGRDEWALCPMSRVSEPPAYVTRQTEDDDG